MVQRKEGSCSLGWCWSPLLPWGAAGSWSPCWPPGPPGSSLQSCFPAGCPQPPLVHGVIPPQRQGFAFPMLNFIMFLLDHFSCLPKSLPALELIDCSPWLSTTGDLTDGAICPVVLFLNQNLTNSSSWTLNHCPPPFDSGNPANFPPALCPNHSN